MKRWKTLFCRDKRFDRPVSHFSWLHYFAALGLMGALTLLPALMYAGRTDIPVTQGATAQRPADAFAMCLLAYFPPFRTKMSRRASARLRHFYTNCRKI